MVSITALVLVLMVPPPERDAWQPVVADATSEKIVFTASDDIGQWISTISTDGTGYTRITRGFHAQWSPDGTRIVFARAVPIPGNEVDGADVFVISADGTTETNLTGPNPARDAEPAFAPDGTTIAFSSVRDGVPGVFTMDPSGGGVTLLVAYGDQPTWSPDGTRLAFRYSPPNSNTDIGVIDADGSGFGLLTGDSVFDAWPSWSPDGSRIAWTSNLTIATMNPDGTGRVDVTDLLAGADARQPAWSPDSATIVYSTYRAGGGGAPFNYRLWAADRNGGNEREIYAGFGAGDPSWGPAATVPELDAVVIAPDSPAMRTKSSRQFTATGIFSDGSTADLTTRAVWSSSRPRVATISADGLATAANDGRTVITATIDSCTASTVLTVRRRP